MLELASFIREFLFIVYVKGLGEKALCQAMAADDILSPLAAFFRENNHLIAVASVFSGGTECHVATIEHLLVRVWFQRVLSEIDNTTAPHALTRSRLGQCAFHFHAAQFGGLAVFRQHV